MAGTTIYVTKDAIDSGIRGVRAFIIPSGHACIVDGRGMAVPGEMLLNPDEYWGTFSEAQLYVAEMVSINIASLEKQLATLRSLDLSKPVEG